jgi:hypothetical protein
MRAVEVAGNIDEQGHLVLDEPVEVISPGRVRVLILFTETMSELENNNDNDSTESVKASLQRALLQAKTGQRIPISQMWEGIDGE